MNQVFKFGLVLGLICLAATLVLAVTYEVTKPIIEAQARDEETAALKEIIPDATSFVKKSSGGMEYFEAMKNGRLAGYCIKALGNGYGGYIRMVVGVDTSGVILGVRVLEQQETPGLGTQITEVKPPDKEPFFLKQFAGKDGRTVAIGKNIDAITGATISSRAVTDGVNKAVTEFLAKVKR